VWLWGEVFTGTVEGLMQEPAANATAQLDRLKHDRLVALGDLAPPKLFVSATPSLAERE
jgi:hypothetical protein